MERQVGKQHGTGKKSPFWNQPGRCSLISRMTSGLVSRFSGSNSTCRPEWVTGWNATERTAGWSMPYSMIAPSSCSFRPRSTAATRVTVRPCLGAVVQGPLLERTQVPAADLQVGALVEAVELEIDVHRLARHVVAFAEFGNEVLVGGQADAVGVDVDVLDGAGLGEVDEVQDVLVDGGLAAGEHHHLRLTLGRHEGVEHPLALLVGDGVAVRLVAGVGEADRAVQVAAGVDLDDAQAGVLLVLRAQPAVARAAVLHLGLEGERDGAGLVEREPRTGTPPRPRTRVPRTPRDRGIVF